MPSVGTKRLLSRCGTVLSGNGSLNATGTSVASLSARSRSTSSFARFLVSVMGHRFHSILLQRSNSSMFPMDVLLLFDGLRDEVDCRHHGEANERAISFSRRTCVRVLPTKATKLLPPKNKGRRSA